MILAIIKNIVRPRSSNEDRQRKEFILNVLLLSATVLFIIASITSFFVWISETGTAHTLIPPTLIVALALFSFLLYWFSIHGLSQLSSYILIGIFMFIAFWMGYKWGLEVTSSLLLYTLVIVMAGVLINTRCAFLMTGLIASILILLGHFQRLHIVVANYQWRNDTWEFSDTFITIVIFLIIATVSWLSNREIECSLARARRSEDALCQERDSLEGTIIERTREIKEMQLEKIAQLYSFAEFGRLSSGLFHDLINPLTAVSLNVEKAKYEGLSHNLLKAEQYLDQAFVATKRMERFVVAVRGQITKKGSKKIFCLYEETRQVMEILSYKAHVASVVLTLKGDSAMAINGDPILWNQVILNLLSNAIDAYDFVKNTPRKKEVVITMRVKGSRVHCQIIDHGIGILTENINKIFDPFFTTKSGELTKGTGLGLSIVRQIVEKDFKGSVSVKSIPNTYTAFLIVIPK